MDQIAQTLYRLAKQVEGLRESRDQMGVEQSPGTAVGQQVCAENLAGNGAGLEAAVSRQGKPHDTAVNDRSLFCEMCVCVCACVRVSRSRPSPPSHAWLAHCPSSNHGGSNGGSKIVPGQTESAPLENVQKSKVPSLFLRAHLICEIVCVFCFLVWGSSMLQRQAHETKEGKPLHYSTRPHDRLALFPTPRVLLGVGAGDEEGSSMVMSEVPHAYKDHARESGNGIENRRHTTTPPTNTNPDVLEVHQYLHFSVRAVTICTTHTGTQGHKALTDTRAHTLKRAGNSTESRSKRTQISLPSEKDGATSGAVTGPQYCRQQAAALVFGRGLFVCGSHW